jgi:hypothetical protein
MVSQTTKKIFWPYPTGAKISPTGTKAQQIQLFE